MESHKAWQKNIQKYSKVEIIPPNFFFLTLGPIVQHVRLVPQPGMETMSLHWEHRLLTTGPTGKSNTKKQFDHNAIIL